MSRATNARSTLRRRRRSGAPMDEFDRLPPELRDWLRQAALPWSPASALRLWQRALMQEGRDPARALDRLARAEAGKLDRDIAATWGPGHPGAAQRT